MKIFSKEPLKDFSKNYLKEFKDDLLKELLGGFSKKFRLERISRITYEDVHRESPGGSLKTFE